MNLVKATEILITFLTFQTLKALDTGKIVTYTGHRIKLLNYQSLTEKDIIQVAVNTDNTGWTVHGENFVQVCQTTG